MMFKLMLAGDSHGNISYMGGVYNRAQYSDVDAIFQLGDFGYGRAFNGDGSDNFTDKVSRLAVLTGIPCYWLPGNHENYDALDALVHDMMPEIDGTYQIEPDVFYVPRGTVLQFGDKRVLCCGGATSVDQDYRILGKSYWKQELITYADIAKCAEAGKVDWLFAHDFPWECNIMDRHLDPQWGDKAQREVIENRQRISRILDTCGATEMFHGHLHIRYTERITTASGTRVKVRGMAADNNALDLATKIIEIEDSSD